MCYNCLENYDAQKSECPRCGYLYDTPHNPNYIAPGTILHDRYIVGVLIGYNGEGANYTAYDKNMGCKVLIREYMPAALCSRVKNKAVISVNYNNLAKYKAFMAEFTELNKSLARFRNNSNIIPVIDMFAENNTTYTVSEYIEGIKLLDYLKDNAGELPWEKVRKIFPPLFTTIGIIHNAGIIHRAISPETIYVTENGDLKLSGFCVSSVRTADAGLEYELFKGYSAPEQYSASTSSRQGSWTDVYGISALLYRVLTGCMPLDASSRLQDDTLCEPSVLNKNIPQHVSRVIMEGLNLSGRDRIQTITELVTKLFDEPAPVVKPISHAKPSVHDEDMLHTMPISYPKQALSSNNTNDNNPYRQQPQQNKNNHQNNRGGGYYDEYEYESVSTIDRFKAPVIIGVLLLALLLIAIVAVVTIMGDDKNSDSSNNSYYSSSVPDNVIPGATDAPSDDFDSTMLDLKGKFFDITQQKYSESFTLEKTEEFNSEYASGQIFEQDLAPGAPFKKGATVVKVKVSKGPAEVVIPDYKGFTVTQYESKLTDAGVPYQLIEDTSGNGTPNSVTRIEVRGEKTSPGNKVNIASGEKLMVYFVIKDATTTTVTTTTEEVTTTTETTTTTTTVQTEPPTEAPTQAPTEPPQQNDQPVAPPPENNGDENNNAQ